MTSTCSNKVLSLNGRIKKILVEVALKSKYKKLKVTNYGKIVFSPLLVPITDWFILLMASESKLDKNLMKYKSGCLIKHQKNKSLN